MGAVEWSQVDPDSYERMIAVLISRLHPDAQRIDGSGGDGGRDVRVPLARGSELYELKSFTGRLDRSRRRQVERSLTKAATHRPGRWSLVVPIDPSPAEDEWFDGLRNQYAFPLRWLGLTWLDCHMADFPSLVRYYLQGGVHEAFDALKELHKEQTVLAGGLPDAVERVSRLLARLEDLDPHWRFGLRIDLEPRVTFEPRYPGAEKDAPITMTYRFAFDGTPEGRATEDALRSFVDYGTPVAIGPQFVAGIDAKGPVEFPADDGPCRVEFSRDSPTDLEPARLVAIAPGGEERTSLPLVPVSLTGGERGVEWSGTDGIGSLSVRLRIHDEERVVLTLGF